MKTQWRFTSLLIAACMLMFTAFSAQAVPIDPGFTAAYETPIDNPAILGTGNAELKGSADVASGSPSSTSVGGWNYKVVILSSVANHGEPPAMTGNPDLADGFATRIDRPPISI